ncbi:hypothetical protein [Sorangium sp. So ce124]|uniref:hypothetical protein n=1 Tax=Sorangium sp. So ce124 TaxID=3133280 RepID=UPI003F5FD559
MKRRFREEYDYSPRPVAPGSVTILLVACPRCCERAELARRHEPPQEVLSCSRCGHIEQNPSGYRYWLRVACCGHTLYAINSHHLALLELYIACPLRERLRMHWADRDYLATLPRWMCLAKNRNRVLRGIRALRNNIVDS